MVGTNITMPTYVASQDMEFDEKNKEPVNYYRYACVCGKNSSKDIVVKRVVRIWSWIEEQGACQLLQVRMCVW